MMLFLTRILITLGLATLVLSLPSSIVERQPATISVVQSTVKTASDAVYNDLIIICEEPLL